MEQERAANKRFRILEDYDKRKRELEEHAVKLVLQQDVMDQNLPMIPAVQSAALRSHCYACGTSFWGTRERPYCDDCTAQQRLQQKLNYELAAAKREITMLKVQRKLDLIEQAKREGTLNELLDEMDFNMEDVDF